MVLEVAISIWRCIGGRCFEALNTLEDGVGGRYFEVLEVAV